LNRITGTSKHISIAMETKIHSGRKEIISMAKGNKMVQIHKMKDGLWREVRISRAIKKVRTDIKSTALPPNALAKELAPKNPLRFLLKSVDI